MILAVIGNTIKLRVEFKDFNSDYIDPDDITFAVYDSRKQLVGGVVPITAVHKIDAGIYEVNYTIPEGTTDLMYEFKGFMDGLPTVIRGKVTREWY